MTRPKKPRKLERKSNSPARKKAVTGPFVRELLENLERTDRALATAKLYADNKDDFLDSIEALVEVVDQQGTVLRDLLLALEEDSDL